jgi:hypothetical protein
LIRIIKRNEGALILIAPILLLVGSILLVWLHTPIRYDSSHSFLQILFGEVGASNYPKISLIVSALLAIVTSVLTNRLIQNLGMLGKLSNIPLLVMSLLFFVMPLSLNQPIFWICILMQLVFINQCVSIIASQNINQSIFNSAFVLGLMILLEPYFIALFSVIFGALVISAAFTARRIGLTLIAFFLPMYFLGSLVYLFAPSRLYLFFQTYTLKFDLKFNSDYLVHWILPLLLVISILHLNQKINRSSTLRDKRKWQLEIMLFATSGLALFLGNADYFISISILGSTIIISRILASASCFWIADLILGTLISLVVINLWY